MNNIIFAALTRTRSVLMIFVLLMIAGAVTYATIPKESNPDVPIPVIYVSIVVCSQWGIKYKQGGKQLSVRQIQMRTQKWVRIIAIMYIYR